jgi:hypothetical protein
LVLANDLAEAVADFGAAIAIRVCRLRSSLFWLGDGSLLEGDPISSTEQRPIP